MTRPLWLLIDVSGLAYRAMHTLGELSHDGAGTGAIYGTLQSVLSLRELFGTDRIAWCFDGGYQERLKISRSYKQNRSKERTPEEEQARAGVREQLERLRRDILPGVGFRNVFWQRGYEADDLIASCCENLQDGEDALIISGDHDFWQLLSPRISVWLPHWERVYGVKHFVAEWGVEPSQWADVLAIAGCDGDNVIGVDGVAEKTAIKFLQGKLKSTSKKFQAIVDNRHLWEQNLPLVRLPLPGTERCVLIEDRVQSEWWDTMVERLGMKRLVGRMR